MSKWEPDDIVLGMLMVGLPSIGMFLYFIYEMTKLVLGR